MTEIDLSCYDQRKLVEAYEAHRVRLMDLARATFGSRELVEALGYPAVVPGLDPTNVWHQPSLNQDAWDLLRLLSWGLMQNWDRSVGYTTEVRGATTLTGNTSTLFTAHGLPKEPATLAAHNWAVRDEDGNAFNYLKSAPWHLHRYVDALTRLGRMVGFQADRKTNATTPMGAIEQAMEQELVRLANAMVKLVEERSYEGGLEYRTKRPVIHRGYLRSDPSYALLTVYGATREEWVERAQELRKLYAS